MSVDIRHTHTHTHTESFQYVYIIPTLLHESVSSGGTKLLHAAKLMWLQSPFDCCTHR